MTIGDRVKVLESTGKVVRGVVESFGKLSGLVFIRVDGTWRRRWYFPESVELDNG